MEQKTIIGIVVVLALAVAAVFFIYNGQGIPTGELQPNMNQGGLVLQDVVVGEGEEAAEGARLRVHYVGTLENGQQFDSSRTRGEPFEFVLGAGQVIPGWDQGLRGMKVGGKRVMIVPPQLGYGDRQIGSIPPNSTLIFEVELLEVLEQ